RSVSGGFRAGAALALWTGALVAFAGEAELPEPPQHFVWNPTYSMDSGAQTLAGLRWIAFQHDAPLRERIALNESSFAGKAGGIFERIAKWVFIDEPLISFSDTVLHEAYGHGARGREAGAKPYYDLELPWPYSALSSRKGVAGSTVSACTGDLERDTQMGAAGIEAEMLEAR